MTEEKLTSKEFLTRLGKDGELRPEINEILTLYADSQRLRRQADAAEMALRKKVTVYYDFRLDLLIRKIHDHGKNWCTACKKLFDAKTIKQIYIEGEHWRGSEYTEHIARFGELHEACPDCYQNFQDQSGRNEKGNKFLAFRVGKGERVLEYNRFGVWTKIPSNAKTMEGWPTPITDEMAEEYGIPPDLSYVSGHDGPNLKTVGGIIIVPDIPSLPS